MFLGLFLLRSLAQDHGVLNLRVVPKSIKVGRSVGILNVYFGWSGCRSVFFLVSPLLLCLLLLRSSSFSLLRGLCPGTGACILLSFSFLSLDDLTMPPYSPLPPSHNDPFVGNCSHLLRGIKMLGFGSFFFSYSSFLLPFSVLLSRDTAQVNRALTQHCTFVSASFSLLFGAHGRLFFFVSFVFISLTATFRLGKLAI